MIGEAKGITGRGFQQPCCWTGVLPVGIWLGLFWLIQYPHGDLCHRPPNGHSFSGTGTKNRRNHVLPFTRSRCPRMATRRTTAASERIAAMWMMGHPAYRPRAISTPTPLYTLRRTRSNRESQDRRCELPPSGSIVSNDCFFASSTGGVEAAVENFSSRIMYFSRMLWSAKRSLRSAAALRIASNLRCKKFTIVPMLITTGDRVIGSRLRRMATSTQAVSD